MRLLRHLLFALNSAWQSFWRNAGVSVAAVVSITLILVLAGVNLLVGHALAGVVDTYKTRVSVISVAVADQTPLAAVYQFFYLLLVRRAVKRQLQTIGQPSTDNPLGRVLAAFKGDASRIEEDAEVE